MSFNPHSFDAGPSWPVFSFQLATADATAADQWVTAAPSATTKRIVIDDLWITSEVEQNITVKNAANTVLFGPLLIAENGLLPLTLRNGINALVVNSRVKILGDAAGNVKADCRYHEVPN